VTLRPPSALALPLDQALILARVPRLPALLAAVAMSLLVGRVAHATPTARLVYSRTAAASSCPDEQSLRRSVAARIGYDPFFAWAKRTIVAGLAREGDVFVGKVELVDEGGVAHGERELHAQGPCSELLDTVALAIAIAIDPQSVTAPASSAPPAPPRAESVPPPPPAAPAQAEPPAPREQPQPTPSRERFPLVDAFAGISASTGVAPTPALGLGLGAALRWRYLSLGLEGRVDAPAGTDVPSGGTVSSWLALGAFATCLHWGPALGCALVQMGSMQSSGKGEPNTRSQSAPWFATGGRIGAVLAVVPDVDLRIRVDVLANLEPVTLELNGADVWPAPGVAASLGMDGVLHFR
jgi:hypothetical protein